MSRSAAILGSSGWDDAAEIHDDWSRQTTLVRDGDRLRMLETVCE